MAASEVATLPKNKKRNRLTAMTADKYELYQKSVQDPEPDVRFMRSVYRTVRGRHAKHLREDFCGTALLSSTWVKKGPDFTAEGFDLDPEPLAWGREHNVAPLGDAAERLTLHQKDVREVGDRPADIRCAQNFSFQTFQTRAEMLDYFRRVHDELADDGIFIMDLYGGTESTEDMIEERKLDGFTYIWDQQEFHPATGYHRCVIHFRFRDGSELKDAFTYTWRLWSMSELKDVLADAGFARVDTYFEQYDDDGDGTGDFALDDQGPSCEGWLAYIVAIK